MVVGFAADRDEHRPIAAVFPQIPLKPTFFIARRGIGISAAVFGVAHVLVYLWSLLRLDWRELYSPGWMWIAGILLGIVVASDMLLLTVTSNDTAVKRMGGRKWKRLHRSTYPLLGLALVHALLVGGDFGVNRAPDLQGQPDAGAGIGFVGIAAVWLALFVLRSKRISWRWSRSRPI